MPDSNVWLLDANILLRISKSDDPHYATVRKAVWSLVLRAARIYFTSQVLGEFWNVCTRPRERNGLGLSVADADRLARVIERDFQFLPDNRDVHDRWRLLLVEHRIKGVQVHDARLAASMYVHGIDQLLTLNVRDFQRFRGLQAIHPTQVLEEA